MADSVEDKIRVENDVEVPMRDGTLLRADIYLPDSEGPFPTIVSRTPYDKSRPDQIEVNTALAEVGYAVLDQDIRGRWASDGEFHPLFSEDWTDAEDGYDTIEWAAAQGWSNGKVGTYGYSYNSWTQWALAPTNPPHLVTMFTGGMTPRITDWMLGGIFRPGRQLQWTLGSMATDTQRLLDEPRGPTTVAEYEYLDNNVNREKWLWYLPYGDFPPEAIGGLRERFQDWLDHMHEERWGFDEQFERIDLPIFHRTGWYDRLVLTVDMFRGMHERGGSPDARANQRMIVGSWTHASALERETGQVDFGPEAEVSRLSLMVDWFDYWLKGEQNGVMDAAPARIFVMGANMWRNEQEWPLSRAVETTLYLRSGGNANTPAGDGTLSSEPSEVDPPDRYIYDPKDPVMSLYAASGHDEPHDHRVLDHRRDILVYQTEPLDEAIEITGHPKAILHVSSDAPDTDFIVRLVDVWPDGFSQNICYGILRTRFRNGLESPELMAPGQTNELEILMLPTSNLFLGGHRIRIDVTSSDFPNFDRNHNTGRNDYQDPELAAANQTVFHDSTRPSRIVLPVVPQEQSKAQAKR